MFGGLNLIINLIIYKIYYYNRKSKNDKETYKQSN